jgi:protein-glucosylgalactosylhydroxylysine glucosidase
LEKKNEAIPEKWEAVLKDLSLLPVQNNVYLAAESAQDSYTNPEFKTDHPSVLGTFGMLPETAALDKKIMRNTFDLVWDTWSWQKTWGWDFPMVAMSAARLQMPEKAIDALFMDVVTNTYLKNGHNYQSNRLTLYLPGNGGLLTTVAMMCGGWEGTIEANPGFPKDGTWKVKSEGFQKMF